jgi:hypothetical protein
MSLEVDGPCFVVVDAPRRDRDALLPLVELEKRARRSEEEGLNLALMALVGKDVEGIVEENEGILPMVRLEPTEDPPPSDITSGAHRVVGHIHAGTGEAMLLHDSFNRPERLVRQFLGHDREEALARWAGASAKLAAPDSPE